MARCVLCSQIGLLPLDRREYAQELRTWESQADLASSAQSGCDCCMLVYYHTVRNQFVQTSRYDIDTTESSTSGQIVLNRAGRIPASDIYFIFFNHVDVTYQINIPTKRSEVQMHNLLYTCETDYITQARRLLNNCSSKHDVCEQSIHCTSASLHRSLPRRLLDLSHDSSIIVIDVGAYLDSGIATVSQLSQYCTLSYCWGTAVHDCILKAPFSSQFCLPFGTMPQTFKDAIITTRGLGIPFLWIDALCIVQPTASGNIADWEVEGSRMGLIYQNAVCTIAATCADSADDGFLSKVGSDYIHVNPCTVSDRKQEGCAHEVQTVQLMPASPSLQESIENATLNNRGWVTQERIFSRKILHFTRQGVFRECYVSQEHGRCDGLPDSRQYGSRELNCIRAPHKTSHQQLPDWPRFVQAYSKTEFSNNKDRLIALSSLARAIQPVLGGDQYYAGLWRSTMIDGILWYATSPLAGSEIGIPSIAPSWSWASAMGRIEYPQFFTPKYLVQVIDVSAAPAQLDNPYGNLERGELKLRGSLAEKWLPMRLESDSRDKPDLTLAWDRIHDDREAEKLYTVLPCAVRYTWTHKKPGSTGVNPDSKDVSLKLKSFSLILSNLVLEPVSQGSTVIDNGQNARVYRRIGYLAYEVFFLKGEWAAKVPFDQYETIVLV